MHWANRGRLANPAARHSIITGFMNSLGCTDRLLNPTQLRAPFFTMPTTGRYGLNSAITHSTISAR